MEYKLNKVTKELFAFNDNHLVSVTSLDKRLYNIFKSIDIESIRDINVSAQNIQISSVSELDLDGFQKKDGVLFIYNIKRTKPNNVEIPHVTKITKVSKTKITPVTKTKITKAGKTKMSKDSLKKDSNNAKVAKK